MGKLAVAFKEYQKWNHLLIITNKSMLITHKHTHTHIFVIMSPGRYVLDSLVQLVSTYRILGDITLDIELIPLEGPLGAISWSSFLRKGYH